MLNMKQVQTHTSKHTHGEAQHGLFIVRDMTVKLTWDTQAPVVIAHAATHSVGTRVEGTEIHQLSTRRPSEAGWAATAKPPGTRTLRVARGVIVTGVGGAWVHFLLTRSRLIT